jgi:hypothetical protein
MSFVSNRLCATALLAIFALQAHALGRLADLRLVDRSTGATLPVYFHSNTYWVAGRPGAKYAISLCNRVGERLLAVTSVDGVNVLSGATASWGQDGYVFTNHSCSEITGWRKSDREVAAFEFSRSSDSYAERTGRPNEVGVIGVALFRERIPEPVASPIYRDRGELGSFKESSANSDRTEPSASQAAPVAQETADAAKSMAGRQRNAETGPSSLAAAPRPLARLGTAHGQREESLVSHTQFERAQLRPNEIIRIRYDSREALIALGVIPSQEKVPNPFPMSDSASYVPDPPVRRY